MPAGPAVPTSASTEHAGVVRDEDGLLPALARLDDIDTAAKDLGVHPDQAGFQDLAHAFDLRSSLIAARATVEAALQRRETRGCHNRSDYPNLDESLLVNMVWSGPGNTVREKVAAAPVELAAFVREVSAAGKLVEGDGAEPYSSEGLSRAHRGRDALHHRPVQVRVNPVELRPPLSPPPVVQRLSQIGPLSRS